MIKISFENIRQAAKNIGNYALRLSEKIRRVSPRVWLYVGAGILLLSGGLYWLLRPAPPGPDLPIVEVEPVVTGRCGNLRGICRPHSCSAIR